MNNIETALRQLVFSWERSSANEHDYEFNPNLSESEKAFGAALLTAREALLGYSEVTLPTLFLPPADSWLKTQWAPDFELGRWIVLLWTVSQFQGDMPNTFWDEQKEIFAQLHAVFSARQETNNEAKQLLSLLNEIEKHLDKLPTDDTEVYDELGVSLGKMMDFLAPSLSH
ncbi:MAG: hypothetical protein DRR16_25595 [Candidatus Parabeggiatoa sp. nov. 3]|nr:MAG: hypothetical protein DRR16_25595 [Gammaproteobacteria bacterium]